MIILEVVDHLGRIKERLQYSGERIRVGRGYDNDLILNDPFVCAHHLELQPQPDGSLMVRDLESLNGLYHPGQKQRVESLLLADDEKFRIGHTTLRYRTPEHPVGKTRQDRLRANLFNTLLNSWTILGLGYLTLALCVTLLTYLGSYTDFEPLQLFRRQLLPYAMMLLVWAGFWALISRITTHSFYFKAHSIIATVTLLASLLYEELVDPLLRFAFNLDTAVDQLTLLYSLLLIAAAFYAHMRFCSIQTSKRLVLYAMIFSSVVVGVNYMESIEGGDDFSSYPTYHSLTYPPEFKLVDDRSLDEFFADSEQLKSELQQQVDEAKEEE